MSEDTSGFYKKNVDPMIYAPGTVTSATYVLFREQKDVYTYPIDGWFWFDSLEAAEAAPFYVAPVTGPDGIPPQVKAAISAAMDFGKSLIIDFSAENILSGKTVAEVKQIATDLSELQLLLLSGSLYVSLDLITNYTPTPLITQAVLNKFRDRIRTYLKLPPV